MKYRYPHLFPLCGYCCAKPVRGASFTKKLGPHVGVWLWVCPFACGLASGLTPKACPLFKVEVVVVILEYPVTDT